MKQTGPAAASEVEDTGWRGLYLAGGAAALLAALVFRRNWSAELVLLQMLGVIDVGPATTPVRSIEWFALLQDSPVLGLILLDFVDLVNYALVGLVYLGLYGALRRTSRGAMAFALAAGLVGVGVAFASNQALSMLALSERFAAATSDAQRAMFLAAGEALLAISGPGASLHGTGTYISLFLVTLAGLVISLVMLRNRSLGSATAWAGILAHGVGLGYFVALGFAPALLAVPPSVSALFLLAWNILVGAKLLLLWSRGRQAQMQ